MGRETQMSQDKDYFPQVLLFLGIVYIIAVLVCSYINPEAIESLLWQAIPFLIAGSVMTVQDKMRCKYNDKDSR